MAPHAVCSFTKLLTSWRKAFRFSGSSAIENLMSSLIWCSVYVKPMIGIHRRIGNIIFTYMNKLFKIFLFMNHNKTVSIVGYLRALPANPVPEWIYTHHDYRSQRSPDTSKSAPRPTFRRSSRRPHIRRIGPLGYTTACRLRRRCDQGGRPGRRHHPIQRRLAKKRHGFDLFVTQSQQAIHGSGSEAG